ncbi:hypothetical protein CERSUDRAFT_97720 [Gelatoporia subvermispora B]|uniref:Uncharacterized protein n=1 Tax=Ceriporiopsis subvermispora (strain B) TaxID=914234 RepID=M2R7T3_CERS8|nr:hypothetical protein CERSUDRAFT_97720 [Gelatoporia subvermispora B]
MYRQLFFVLTFAICIVSANPIKAVNCGGTNIKVGGVQRNLNEGVRLQRSGQQIPSGDSARALYPHTYNDRDGLNLARTCPGQLWEFPLVKGDQPFKAGEKAGPNRVVFSQTGDYCASITHTGASTPNGFVLCKNVA